MFIDGRKIPAGKVLEADVCIIGAGAAGITIARAFMNTRTRVIVVESGGLEYEHDTQELYAGSVVGLPYPRLDSVRLRLFGGATNHWGGFNRILSPFDFEEKSWIPESGWPITKSDLDPFYETAFETCLLGAGIWRWDTEFWRNLTRGKSAFANSLFDVVVSQRSRLTAQHGRSFGRFYRVDFERSHNAAVYLYSNLTELETNPAGTVVTRIRVACLSGNHFYVKARIFVLATGGIENARVLLASRKTQKFGLGNEHDLVGRYFTDHFSFSAGRAFFLDGNVPDSLLASRTGDYGDIWTELGLPPSIQARERMLNTVLWFGRGLDEFYLKASNSKGVQSLNYLFGRDDAVDETEDLASHIGNIVRDLDDILISGYRRAFIGSVPARKYYDCVVRLDPSPNANSRVTLMQDRDKLGVNKIQVSLQLNSSDKFSVQRAVELLGTELGRLGLGRVQSTFSADSDWPPDYVEIGPHHCCTTRMSETPRDGVVDRNCRVHGVGNLYIAGSSVFRTVTSTTPTMTIVALALRLAHHVKGLLR